MFSLLLDSVDSHCPLELRKVSDDQHKALLNDALPLLSIDSEPLLGASKALLGETVFDSSAIAFEYSQVRKDEAGLMDLPIAFGCMYIRAEKPKRELSLEMSIYRSFKTPARHYPSCVALNLEINSLQSKQALEALYCDYRASTIRLLEYGQIEFEASYCSDIVGKTKSKKTAAKLDEYFSDREVDNCFTLTRQCPRGTSHSSAMRSFLALSLLYSACRSSLAGRSGAAAYERNVRKLT